MIGKIDKQQISYNLYESLIVDALELGSDYWAMVDIDGIKFPQEYDELTLTEKIAKAIWYQNATLPIYNRADETLLGKVNIKSIKNAFEEMARNETESYKRILNESFTEEDSDTFLQIATMGFVRYK
jgi:hypothetical protein